MSGSAAAAVVVDEAGPVDQPQSRRPRRGENTNESDQALPYHWGCAAIEQRQSVELCDVVEVASCWNEKQI